MFTKVLIVDDIDLNNVATIEGLKDLNIKEIVCAKYCDEALLKIKKAHQDNKPFQLLITDLSFKVDHRENTLHTGEDLIQAVKQLHPDIKIIVFSIEDRPFRIKQLFEKYKVDGYVMKDRNTIPELQKTIQKVYLNEQEQLSLALTQLLQDKTTSEINNYDIQVIKQLSLGVPQENMEAKFKELGITPSSKSTIEKHINKLKIYFKANNTVHLVAIAKDLGLV
jgi:two-component system, NarL family, captular synthesis response regulator RcsB